MVAARADAGDHESLDWATAVARLVRWGHDLAAVGELTVDQVEVLMRGHRAVDEIEHRNLVAAIRAAFAETPPLSADPRPGAPIDGDIRYL